jgi:hypothetical protein
MGSQRAVIGAGLLAVLAIADIISVLATYTPLAILVIIVALSLITLGALAMWATGRSRRPAMWTAVASMSVAALLGIPPMLFPDMSVGARAYFAIFIVLTIAAIILVRGELTRAAQGTPSTAKIA